jgi:hypothetical protein
VPELVELQDDGCLLPKVGDWSERKYRLIATYAEMFATAMREKWNARSYRQRIGLGAATTGPRTGA